MKNLICLFNLLNFENQCCCDLFVALLFLKHGDYFPGFKVLLFIFFYNVVFDFVTADEFLDNFAALESFNWFVLKIFFEGFVN